ncbi:hypothetical protein [Acinetobacter sp. WZC-1]|uniref:hypothetical protein n=1 Tax=Acinetobacter sp. WZC-1 TaxID=3459034 RepID=UPI00403D6384
MNTKIFVSILLSGLCLSSYTQANDKVETTYNPQKYQQVCKNKKQGDQISFAYKGIVWNGSCEPQFFATKSTAVKGNEPELNTTCASDASAKSVTIEGKEIKGKCALGFAAPQPKS